MALENWQKQKNEISDTDHLMCSVQGCGNRWSVRMDGEPAFCSPHKWGGAKSINRSVRDAVLKPATPHWQDEEQF